MADHVTPNLPSRDYGSTVEFYAKLGFETSWHDDSWLIIKRGGYVSNFSAIPTLILRKVRSGAACEWIISTNSSAPASKPVFPSNRQAGYVSMHQTRT